MNRIHWLTIPAWLVAAHVWAQAAPTAQPAATKPAQPAAAHEAKPARPKAAHEAKPAPPKAVREAKPARPKAAHEAKADGSVEWHLDPIHSRIGFTARHLGFSRVEGHFNKFAAQIKADPKTAKITALEATAEAASVDTGIERRDNDLRSDDFFNAAKYPQMKLVLKSIRWRGKKFRAKTDLTIRDVTKQVPFTGELLGVHKVDFGQGPQQRAAYEAKATISRAAFGLKYSGITEGLAIVGDPIELDLSIEMSYVPAPQTAATPTPAPATTTAAATLATGTRTASSAAAPAPARPGAGKHVRTKKAAAAANPGAAKHAGRKAAPVATRTASTAAKPAAPKTAAK